LLYFVDPVKKDFKLANRSLVRIIAQVKMFNMVKGLPLLGVRIALSILNIRLAGRPLRENDSV